MATSIIRSRRATVLVVTTLLGALVLSGCTSGRTASWQKPGDPATGGDPAHPIKVAIDSPKPDAKNVVTSTEIVLELTGAKKTDVVLKSAGGKTIPGEFREDGKTWVPGQQLEYGTTYAVKVTGTNSQGAKATKESKFTTMNRSGQIMGAGLYLFDDETVGVGMPVVIEFTRPVTDRAAVERRLFVKSDPPVEGAWHWYSDSQVHYRPKDYWKPGTKISVRIAIGGMPFGQGWYGKRDRIARNVTVGDDVRMSVENKTKKMTITKNGNVIKTMPVSLGKPSMPSSSGNLVIMDKRSEMMFDSSTFGIPADSPGGYRTKVHYAMRLTWGGEFIHAAPWSVGDQGHRNVSHGCVNVSMDNARYIYNLVHVGDPVTVKHTEKHVGNGDGWTAWDMSWEDFKAGSALN